MYICRVIEILIASTQAECDKSEKQNKMCNERFWVQLAVFSQLFLKFYFDLTSVSSVNVCLLQKKKNEKQTSKQRVGH